MPVSFYVRQTIDFVVKLPLPMTHKTTARTGAGCYLLIPLLVLAGSIIYSRLPGKAAEFSEDELSYPPPAKIGCKGWDWLHPYLSDMVYVSDVGNPSTLLLAVYAYDNLAFYNPQQHEYTRCLTTTSGNHMKLSPDGRILAVSKANGEIEVRQLGTDALLATRPGVGTSVNQLEFSPNGQFLAFQVDEALYLWDMTHPTRPPRELAQSDAAYNPFTFSAAGDVLAMAGWDKVRQWRTWDWSELPALPLPELESFERAVELKYTPDGRSLILVNDEGFRVIDASDGHEIYRWVEYVGPNEYVNDLALSPDGRYLALTGWRYWNGYTSRSGSRLPGGEAFLHVWRTAAWEYLGQLKGKKGDAITFAPDNRLTADWEGKIRFIRLDELLPALQIPATVTPTVP